MTDPVLERWGIPLPRPSQAGRLAGAASLADKYDNNAGPLVQPTHNHTKLKILKLSLARECNNNAGTLVRPTHYKIEIRNYKHYNTLPLNQAGKNSQK